MVLVGPLADRSKLSGAPYERTAQRAVVGSVVGHPVAGGNHIVETQQVGQRLDHVVGSCGSHHYQTPGGPMLIEQCRGERLHQFQEALACPDGGFLHGTARLALGQQHRLASECHRRQRLANGIEQPIHPRLAWNRAAAKPCSPKGRREHFARCSGKQGAVEIEECGTSAADLVS